MLIAITAIMIVCTACLLSGLLYKVFPNYVIPYIPCIIYTLGGVYFLMLGGAMNGEIQSQLRAWAIVMLVAAFASFGVCAWLQSKSTSS